MKTIPICQANKGKKLKKIEFSDKSKPTHVVEHFFIQNLQVLQLHCFHQIQMQ